MRLNKFHFILLAVLAIFLGVFFVAGNKLYDLGISDKPKVAATIFPLFDIVGNIAGDEVETVLILPPGASPHTFDPTPREVRALSGSRALFAIGQGLDNWAFRMAEGTQVGNIVVVDKYIDLLEAEEDHNEDEDENGHEEYEMDPHYWLSAGNAILIARQVTEELSLSFPEKREIFETNFEAYKVELEELDQELKEKLNELNNPAIATFHNAWSYFARDYPVRLVAVFEEFPGREPTARYISEFQEKVRRNNVKVVFAEPQFSPAALEPIARDLGVNLSILDPLGGVSERETYKALMIYNVERIITAYK